LACSLSLVRSVSKMNEIQGHGNLRPDTSLMEEEGPSE
jgi:hypothetical protein